MKIFEGLVESVILYGAEILGWKRYEEVEKLQRKYLKWTLGLDSNTPKFLVMMDTNRDRIDVKAAKRAVKFEIKNRDRQNNNLVRECLKVRARKEKLLINTEQDSGKELGGLRDTGEKDTRKERIYGKKYRK